MLTHHLPKSYRELLIENYCVIKKYKLAIQLAETLVTLAQQYIMPNAVGLTCA